MYTTDQGTNNLLILEVKSGECREKQIIDTRNYPAVLCVHAEFLEKLSREPTESKELYNVGCLSSPEHHKISSLFFVEKYERFVPAGKRRLCVL